MPALTFISRELQENNMATFRQAVMLKIALARQRRSNLPFQMVTLVAVRRKFRLRLLALLCLLLQPVGEEEERFRCVCKCERNARWWGKVWSTYDNSRFTKTFRVTR